MYLNKSYADLTPSDCDCFLNCNKLTILSALLLLLATYKKDIYKGSIIHVISAVVLVHPRTDRHTEFLLFSKIEL